MNKQSILSFILAVTVLMSCNNDGADQRAQSTGAVITSEKINFRVDTITSELKNPWGMAFLPDGRILVTERSGEIVVVKNDQLTGEKIEGVPAVYANGQGGLLDIQLHPDYGTNGWIYLTYAKPGEGGGGTVLARTKLDGNKFVEFQELFQALPLSSSGVHFGSRIAFDGKGYVFFTSGERGEKENAQKLENHLGKVLRLHDDGRVPTDNPFVGTANAKPEIWSYGHRNLQGLVYDKSSGKLYNHEHGPKGGDELNMVEKGKNYGWPAITYGIDYDGSIISDKTEMPGMEQPLTYWKPSIGPCGMVQVTSDKFTPWKNNLLIGALALTHVTRVELDDNGQYVKQEKLLDKVGRVRAVAQSPDGFIYVATETPGMLLKLSPAQ